MTKNNPKSQKISNDVFEAILVGNEAIQSKYSNIEIADKSLIISNICITQPITIRSQKIPYAEIALVASTISSDIVLECIMPDLFIMQNSSLQNITITENGRIGNIVIDKTSSIQNLSNQDSETKNIYLFGKAEGIHLHGNSEHVSIRGTSQNIEVSGKAKSLSLSNKVQQVFLNGSIHSVRITCEASSLNIELAIIEKLWIVNSVFSIPALVTQSKISEFYLHHDVNEWFGLTASHNSIEKLRIDDTNIGHGSFLKIISCQVKNMYLINFVNQGRFYISSLGLTPIKDQNQSTISITESDLGNTQWINCRLQSYSDFVFSNTKLVDCFFADTTIPNHEQVSSPALDDYKTEDTYNQMRLLFSQLKTAFERQGDTLRSGDAHASELEAYRQQLILRKRRQKKEGKLHKVSRNDNWQIRRSLIVLYANRLSSYYGTNWLHAVLVTIGITVSCFSIYLYLIGYRPGGDIAKFQELYSHVFSFLNPFRFADTDHLLKLIEIDVHSGYLSRPILNDKTRYIVPPLARVWDYISRILVIFMVYQTIAAFRRIGKIRSSS